MRNSECHPMTGSNLRIRYRGSFSNGKILYGPLPMVDVMYKRIIFAMKMRKWLYIMHIYIIFSQFREKLPHVM